MDVYDHLPPRGSHKDDMYILELCSDSGFYETKKLCGVFDCFEAAAHAMDHVKCYQYHHVVEVGDHLVVSSIRKNTLKFRKYNLISWERLSGDEPGKHGVANGVFRLHEGLRKHAVEP